MGRAAEARQGWAALAAQDFADLPMDGDWQDNMAALCEICLAVGETRHAATLYTLWQPYAGCNSIGGVSAASCRGAVTRYLGAAGGKSQKSKCKSQKSKVKKRKYMFKV